MIRRSAWAVVDQGIFAGAHLLINIVLARCLSMSDYGLFAVVFGIFLLCTTVHTGLVTEPLLSFKLSSDPAIRSGYFQFLKRATLVVGGIMAVVLVLVGAVVYTFEFEAMARTIWFAAGSLPSILTLWLVRRFCYLDVGPHASTYVSLGYFVLVAVLLWYTAGLGFLSPEAAFLIMAIAAFAVVIVAIPILRLWSCSLVSDTQKRIFFCHHRSQGPWLIGVSFLIWLSGNAYFLALPLWYGLEMAAALRALSNFVLPALLVFGGVSLALVSPLRQAGATAYGKHVVKRAMVLSLAFGIIYWLALGLNGELIVDVFYAGQYREFAGALWVQGGAAIACAATAVLGAALRAANVPRVIFVGHLINAVFIVSVGLLVALNWGVYGAAFSFTFGYALAAVFMYRRWRIIFGTEIRNAN